MSDNPPRVRLTDIFLTFAMIGLTGFGGGMAIVAMVERICVREKGWISAEEFMHGLAFGQILGPFSLNVCTFTGHHLTYHKLPQLQAALKGTNPVIIGLIVVVAIDMGRKQIKGANGALMALVAFGISVFLKLNAAWVLLGAALWSLCSSYVRRRFTR